MLVASDPSLAEGLLLLSYPLHPPGRASQLRTAHFPTLRTPSLFVSGTRDAFGSIEELEHAIKLIPARTELVPVEGAAHGLATKPSRSEVPKLVVESFRSFFLQE
jgi:predicted alpha/beta-hydrolase family hydrolase